MDIANLAGIHKYNSLSIFQRVIVLFIERFIIEFNRNKRNWVFVKLLWNNSKLGIEKDRNKGINKP